MLLSGVVQNSASATHQTVTAVTGSAFGYFADNISLFGGAQPDTGPTPTVALATDASNSPQTATEASGTVRYGPAYIFTSDRIDVTTSGSLGPSGSVTSSSSIQNVNKSTTQPTVTGSEILTADTVASTCTASESGTTGSTTITNGTLQTDSGFDANGDGDFTDEGEHAPTDQAIPLDPAPGTTYTGHIHLSATSTDYFTVVFNEQVTNSDGSLTVNAVHEHFGTDPPGNTSILQGDLILGQSVCGVNLAATTTTTTEPTTTTTEPETTTTTVPETTTTTEPETTTTTTTTIGGQDGVYYENCTEARAAGAAPLNRDEPGYRPELDGDGDGVACEPEGGSGSTGSGSGSGSTGSGGGSGSTASNGGSGSTGSGRGSDSTGSQSRPAQVARTGASSSLRPLLGVGALLVVVGGLLHVVQRANRPLTRREER